MGLGSTAKKIQTLADRAEQLYVKLKEVHERVLSVEVTVEDTQSRVAELEDSLDRQRAVIEALAEDRGIDVDAVLADAAIEDAHEDAGGDHDEHASEEDTAATQTDDATSTASDGGDADN